MCHNLFLLELSDYLFNFNFRVLLTVTVLHAIALAALLLEDDNLLTLDECIHDFYYYLGTFNSRCTNCDCALVIDEQHLVKLNSLAGFGVLDAVHKQLCALLYLELLTVNFYNYVHFLLLYNGFFREAMNTLSTLFRAPTD